MLYEVITRELLTENRVLFAVGDVDASRDEHGVRVSDVYEPADAPRALAGQVHIELGRDADVGALAELVQRHKGDRPLLFSLSPEPGLRVAVRAEESFGVDP